VKEKERIGPIGKSLNVAEGERSLRNLKGCGRSLKGVEEIRRRRVNQFNPFQSEGPRRLGELKKNRRSLKKRAESESRQQGDAPREGRRIDGQSGQM
jgi:hypothetical protein